MFHVKHSARKKEKIHMKNIEKKDFSALIMEKKERLDILEQLIGTLNNIEIDTKQEWTITGTQSQLVRWNNETRKDELVWKDENGKRTFDQSITGEPYIVDDYDYMPKTEYNDRDKARLQAIELIRNTLADLA